MLSNQNNSNFFMSQYRAGTGAGAGAKIKKKVAPELEPKLNNFDSATLRPLCFFFKGQCQFPIFNLIFNGQKWFNGIFLFAKNANEKRGFVRKSLTMLIQ